MPIVDDIRARHRDRRYAIKMQAKIDRALESFVRINATSWRPDASDKERERANKEVDAIIAAAHEGKGDAAIIRLVQATDLGREPFDAIRKGAEKVMRTLARELPVASWVEDKVRGADLLGLATIVAEAGDLANYPNVAKLWKRLGYAPYDGLAGSSWKRETWRPRALTKDEWIENPFSGERYALMHQIGLALFMTQRPGETYRDLYDARRAHTATTHPDWTKQHSHMDALRVMTKEYLKDLWHEWHRASKVMQDAAE